MSTNNTHDSHAYEYYTLVPYSNSKRFESELRFVWPGQQLAFTGPETPPRVPPYRDDATLSANLNLNVRFPIGLSYEEKSSIYQTIHDELTNSFTCDITTAMNQWNKPFSYTSDNRPYPSEEHTRNTINSQIENTNVHHCYMCGNRRETDEFYIFRIIKDENGNEIVVRICVVEHELNRLDNKPLAYSTSIGKPAVVTLTLYIHIDADSVEGWDCIQQAILEDQNKNESDPSNA